METSSTDDIGAPRLYPSRLRLGLISIIGGARTFMIPLHVSFTSFDSLRSKTANRGWTVILYTTTLGNPSLHNRQSPTQVILRYHRNLGSCIAAEHRDRYAAGVVNTLSISCWRKLEQPFYRQGSATELRGKVIHHVA